MYNEGALLRRKAPSSIRNQILIKVGIGNIIELKACDPAVKIHLEIKVEVFFARLIVHGDGPVRFELPLPFEHFVSKILCRFSGRFEDIPVIRIF